MACSHFRENWLKELPELLLLFKKRELTFIYARDCNGYKSYPYCRYGYKCKYKDTDCQSLYKPKSFKQLSLF